jgi:type IV pilus assembly protein PilA
MTQKYIVRQCNLLISGFSLLELMIVLTIVAILAAIAIPNYQLYVKKAKFSEVITQLTTYRTSVEICAQLLGSLGDEQANCGTPGQNEIPNDFVAEATNKHYVASIRTHYEAPLVVISAVSQGLGASYNYILTARYAEDGVLAWSVDPNSSCLTAGICHMN